jgi:hypothetical protein
LDDEMMKLLTTIDVESLFTRIPQPKLLTIVEEQLKLIGLDEETRQQYLKYIQVIATLNIFRANDIFYLQTIGLAMGGSLSGALANIYLGVLEKEVLQNENILLFNRYMDDILLISTFSETELYLFIENLQEIYQLPLTETHNSFSVTFLDMKIIYSHKLHQLMICPYSRNFPYYPLPSRITRRGVKKEVSILKNVNKSISNL